MSCTTYLNFGITITSVIFLPFSLKLIDWQLKVTWGTYSSNIGIRLYDSSLHFYCVLQSSEVSLIKFLGIIFFDVIILCF